MGKRIPSAAAAATTNLRDFARLAADRLGKARPCQASLNSASSPKAAVRCRAGGVDPSVAGRVVMEGDPERRGERLPLSEVVADCVKRWFQDTLKEAKAGDIAMQVLVGQMYYSGYGINRNVQKVKASVLFSLIFGQGFEIAGVISVLPFSSRLSVGGRTFEMLC